MPQAKRFHGQNQRIRIREIHFEEIEYHVSGHTVITGIHGELAKEITHIGHYHGKCAQTIPQVVQSEESLCSHSAALILQCNKASAQFYGIRQVFPDKLFGKTEHVACGQNRLAILIQFHLASKKITIASQYFLSLGIPYEELFVRILHGIKLIQIHGQSSSASGSAESNLTKTSQLADNIWRILPRNNINLIATLICCPEFLLGSQL